MPARLSFTKWLSANGCVGFHPKHAPRARNPAPADQFRPRGMLAPPRSMLAAGCLGVAATFAYWSILRRLIELKRELQEVKLLLAPRKPQPSVFLASRERQWPDLSGVWEFDASKADLEAIDIYIRYMGTPRLIRPIFSYAMSRMKVQKARSVAAGFAGALIARAAPPRRVLS